MKVTLKSLSKILAVLIFGFMIGYFLAVLYLGTSIWETNDTVNIGDEWSFTLNEEDPFKKNTVLRFYVLDIKDGYVQYWNEYFGKIDSSTIRYFKIGAEKISEDE